MDTAGRKQSLSGWRKVAFEVIFDTGGQVVRRGAHTLHRRKRGGGDARQHRRRK